MMSDRDIELFMSDPIARHFGVVVVKAARAMRLPLVLRAPAPHYWDGRELALLRPDGRHRVLIDVFHDLAHFQLCPSSRVHLPEFGLGSFDDGFSRRAPGWPARSVVPEFIGRLEEHRATLLSMFHLHPHLPQLVDTRLRSIGVDGWEDWMLDVASVKPVRWLRARGLLDGDAATTRTVRD